MPFVGITLAHTCQIRPGTLGTPQVGVFVYPFAGQRIRTVALNFGTEHTDLLRVTAYAAFADIEVATDQLERPVGLDALGSLSGRVLEKQRHDLHQTRR